MGERDQSPFSPSVASPCHPWFTTTNLSYRFPIFETSATALCGTNGIILYYVHYIYIYIYSVIYRGVGLKSLYREWLLEWLSKQTLSCNLSLDMTNPTGKNTQNPSLAQGKGYPWGKETNMDKDTLRHILRTQHMVVQPFTTLLMASHYSLS